MHSVLSYELARERQLGMLARARRAPGALSNPVRSPGLPAAPPMAPRSGAREGLARGSCNQAASTRC